MSAFKPRKVDSNGLFVDDQREEKKFWYLDPVVQAVVGVKDDGQFARLDSPLDFHVFAWAGNEPHQIEDEDLGHIWLLDTFVIESAAGATYTPTIDGAPIWSQVVLAAGAYQTLIEGTHAFNGVEVIACLGGLGADNLFMRAIRVI